MLVIYVEDQFLSGRYVRQQSSLCEFHFFDVRPSMYQVLPRTDTNKLTNRSLIVLLQPHNLIYNLRGSSPATKGPWWCQWHGLSQKFSVISSAFPLCRRQRTQNAIGTTIQRLTEVRDSIVNWRRLKGSAMKRDSNKIFNLHPAARKERLGGWGIQIKSIDRGCDEYKMHYLPGRLLLLLLLFPF